MDIDHRSQRSASHGSLHSSYKAQGRPHHTYHSRPSPHRRPLHSVSENAHLLRSPGPLESMLKTTTETGDIGIFTIKPILPMATYHQPPRSRPGLKDANLLRPSRSRDTLHTPRARGRSRGYDDGYFQDDRRRLPSSYRDTTSEIISLYGSDTLPSFSGSFSPSIDDGRRSYSLTTCSSRHIPSQKSSGTLKSQSDLQRPRSPYPYPTRLRRPGVRPASPALTENGGVDYSKMVELDRVSHRTIHGSYRPIYSQGRRRPPPLSLRPEGNMSTASLPSRASPGPYYMSPGPCQSRTPNSYRAPTPRNVERSRRVSNDQSIRSASLTSIVEMYQRPITSSRNVPPLRSTGSFYYDYTEEFEKDEPPAEPASPLCPIPQRAGSFSRPMVLRAESQACLDDDPCEPISKEGDNESNELETASARLLQDDDLAETPPLDTASSRDREIIASLDGVNETNGGTKNLEMNHQVNFELPAAIRTVTSPVPAEIPAEGVDKSSRYEAAAARANVSYNMTDNPSSHGLWRQSRTLPVKSDCARTCAQKRASQSSLRKFKYTLDPTLSEFASLFNPFDRLAKSPFSKKVDGNAASDDTHTLVNQCEDAVHKEASGGTRSAKRNSVEALGEAKEKPFCKRHRRNLAAHQISTAEISNSLGPKHDISHRTEEIHILSPQPISPVRQLKVKNSIPQLMKALPPLPDEALEHATEQNKFPVLQAARGCSKDVVTTNNKTLSQHKSSRHSPPKFRLRVKKALPPTPDSKSDTDVIDPSECDDKNPIDKTKRPTSKKKLKIKMSRNHLTKPQPTDNGTVLRSPAMKQCNSLVDLELCSRKDMFTSQCRLDAAFTRRVSERTNEANSLVPGVEYATLGASPQPSDQFDIQYPQSPCRMTAGPRASASTTTGTLHETRSWSSEADMDSHYGLRQKFSMLRLRIGGTQRGKSTKALGTQAMGPPFAFGVQGVPMSTREGSDVDGQKPSKSECATSTRSDKAEGRVRRWAKGAKRAVRLCVRRTLDRSSTSNN